MEILNFTPHTVNVFDADGKTIVASFESQGNARVSQSSQLIGHVNGMPLQKPVYGQVIDLPDPHEGTVFIVSFMVAQALKHRHDLIAPNTGPDGVVRNPDGTIAGVKSFLSFSE